MKVSQARLRELFDYDSALGKLRWRLKVNRKVIVGSLAGYAWPSKADPRQTYIRVDGFCGPASRYIWAWHNGDIPERMEIDHRDRNPSNDRIWNLRLATDLQQQANRGKNRNNTSGYKGVWLDKRRGTWCAQVGSLHLGAFASPEAAAAQVQQYGAQIHAEFWGS